MMGQGMQHEAMGLGIGMNTPQPYGVGTYNPYSHQQVYLSSQVPFPSHFIPFPDFPAFSDYDETGSAGKGF